MKEAQLRYGRPQRVCQACRNKEILLNTDSLMIQGPDSIRGQALANREKVRNYYSKGRSCQYRVFFLGHFEQLLRSDDLTGGFIRISPDLKWLQGMLHFEESGCPDYDVQEFMRDLDPYARRSGTVPVQTFDRTNDADRWVRRRGLRLFSEGWLLENSLYFVQYLRTAPAHDLMELLDHKSVVFPMVQARLNGTWGKIEKYLEGLAKD